MSRASHTGIYRYILLDSTGNLELIALSRRYAALAQGINRDGLFHARMPCSIRPATSVSRMSRPLKRNVSRS